MLSAFFWGSATLNLVFIGLFLVLLHRRGGFLYLVNKLNQQKARINPNNSPYYRLKVNQFEQLPCENKIVFLGDSLTDWGEWGELLEHSNIVNRGVAGDTVAGVLNRLEPIIRSRPQQLYLMIGINDLIRKKSVSETVQSYRAVLKKLQKEAPQTKVFIQSLLPVNSKKYRAVTKEKLVTFNRQLQDLAFEFSDTYIDLYSVFSPKNIGQYTVDGLHLNGNGYLLWKDMIKPYLPSDVTELSDVPPL